jgi:predicted transposase/invertase (TIGR01784 family)
MPRYLDPKNDLTFKRIFGEHKNLCMSLLNNLLPLGADEKIVALEYQSGELIPELEISKHSIVDVRCTDQQGRQFLVEMQMYWTRSFKFRAVFNAAKTYVKQLGHAQKYIHLQPVYSLCLVNDIFDQDSEKHYHEYGILNKRDASQKLEGLEFVFIELPKFKPQNSAERKLYDLWLRFLTEVSEATENLPAELLEAEEIREAAHYVEQHAYSNAQLLTYDEYRDMSLIEASVASDAAEAAAEAAAKIAKATAEAAAKIAKAAAEADEQGFNRGLQRGLDTGQQAGQQIGFEKGLEAGEKLNAQRIARKMLSKKISLAEIAEYTGLSIEEIRQTPPEEKPTT